MLKTIINTCLSFIAPAYCPHCGLFITDETAVFCAACEATILPVAPYNLKLSDSRLLDVYAVSSYKDPIKQLILAKASSNRTACMQMGYLMWRRTVLPYLQFDYLVPIPLHWTRFARRGYNQAEVIAHYLAQLSGKPMIKIVTRKRMTKFQSTLTPDQRLANVEKAFIVDEHNAHKIAGKRIMLVDDLMTTGATLQMAAKTIWKLKPAHVNAVVAARVI